MISTYKFYELNSPRSQKTQLTRDMYIFEETVPYFTQYVKIIREKSLVSLGLKNPGHWSSH